MLPDGMGTFYTAGGLAYFDYDELKKHPRNPFFGRGPVTAQIEYEQHFNRKGFYGWYGNGGSIFQWNPEQQVGFGYVPTLLFSLDLCNFRGSILQDLVSKCVAKRNAQQ